MNARWLARVAASAAVRRTVYLVIAAIIALVLSFVPTGKAQAQDYSECFGNSDDNKLCENKQIAYEQALRVATEKHNNDPNYPVTCLDVGWSAGRRYWQCTYRQPPTKSVNRHYYVATACPSGTIWNEDLKQCAPEQCANAIPIEGRATRNALPMCSGGCLYVPAPAETGPEPEISIVLGSFKAGSSWRATGAGCETPNEGEPWDRDKSTCYTHPGASYGECVNPDGSHCVTSATGRKYCWKIGEEGPKRTTDGSEGADRRKAPTPNEPPPSMKDPTETGTNQGGTTINGDVYNTSTFSGTPGEAGQGDTGVPGDEDGDGTVGEGEGEGEEGTSSGGGSCDSPPVSSGDAILAQIALQTWETRCANDQPGWTKGDGPDIGEPEVGDPAEQIELDLPVSTDWLDQENIFGSSSCPTFEIPVPLTGEVMSTSDLPAWCNLLAIMRGVILLWGAYTAIRILQGAVI